MELSKAQLTRTSATDFDLFVPLSKINEATGEFEAWATLEEIDNESEIIDLDKSWPYFQALAKRFSIVTGGQNYGPLREQHDANKAAGHLIAPPEIRTHESGARGVYIHGLITDDGTHKKMVKKTLTGVSIGGSYVGEPEVVKVGKSEVKRFIANPNHYGIVDSPCVKNATLTVVKADGKEVVEKVTLGFTPPQGFLCRAGGFYDRKVIAQDCADDHDFGKIEKAVAAVVAEPVDQKKELAKSLYCVAELATLILNAQSLSDRLNREADIESDYADSEFSATIDGATSTLFDAMLAIVQHERDEHENTGDPAVTSGGQDTDQGSFNMTTPSAAASVEGGNGYAVPMMMADIVSTLKKSPDRINEIIKSLHAQKGSESTSKQEAIMAEVAKKDEAKPAATADATPVEKADTNALAKATDALNNVAKVLEKVVEKSAEVDEHLAKADAQIADFGKAIRSLNKAIRLVAGIQVDADDENDADAIAKAIEAKPAAPKAAVRAVSKVEDSKDEATQPTPKKTGNPLMDDAKLVAVI